MGACFGLFKKKPKKRNYTLQRCVFLREEDKIELELLVDGDVDNLKESEDMSDVWTMSGKLPTNFLSEKYKVNHCKRKLGSTALGKSQQCLLENLRNEDIEGAQIIPLNAHTLLASRAVQKRNTSVSSGTPPSSLDLEWENEGFSCVSKFKSQGTLNIEEVSSCSGCGGNSPPESLEWDPCDPAETDFETEQLINEIEQLTNRALKETGDWRN